jgi:hypothetical protein
MKGSTLTLTTEEETLVRAVVWSLEMSPTGDCLECGRSRMFHLIFPLKCAAVVGMLKARLGLE